MVGALSLFGTLLSIASVALAAPHTRSGSVVTLSASEISSYKPYTQLAAAAYCPANQTVTWSCGARCSAVSGFVPYGAGGDGIITQFWYVGYDPNTQSVIVGHQGTDKTKIIPLLTDAIFALKKPDSSLFPGLPSSIQCHSGFLDSHSRSAAGVLAAVNKAIAAKGAKTVTTVGHSLGGALALLDAVYLRLQLPSSITVKSVTYGLPRTGNPEFASWVDTHIPNFVHINNLKDLVPILPGRSLGFAHPEGEKHIYTASSWVACPGHDNVDAQCTTGQVDSIFSGVLDNHEGPYDGVTINSHC